MRAAGRMIENKLRCCLLELCIPEPSQQAPVLSCRAVMCVLCRVRGCQLYHAGVLCIVLHQAPLCFFCAAAAAPQSSCCSTG